MDVDVDIDMRGRNGFEQRLYMWIAQTIQSHLHVEFFSAEPVSRYHWYIKLPRFQQILPAASAETHKMDQSSDSFKIHVGQPR